MTPSRTSLLLLALLAGPGLSKSEPEQSPPRPAPAWLKLVDAARSNKRLAGYRVPEGVQVEIVVAAPAVSASSARPVGLAFTDDGTPLVLEVGPGVAREASQTISYRDGTTRTTTTWKKTPKDAVKAFAVVKGTGAWDSPRAVAEDDVAYGLLLHDGHLYLSGGGSIRRCKQSRPGGPFDVKEWVAQGFGGRHPYHVSGMTIGPDGCLYITAGAGDHYVEGADGSRATVLRTGAVFRCRPDGSKMETFAIGFCNPRGSVVFDLAGNMFHADDAHEDGKLAGCRLLHIPEGADFGWREAPGDGKSPATATGRPDPVRSAVQGERPGKVPPMLRTGPGSPNGLFICNDTRFPEEYRGLLFYPDPRRRLIRAYKVEPAGASFKVVEEFDFLAAPKDNRSFTPSQMVLGPDGAIHVIDPGQARIYRLSWAGTREQPALPLRGLDSWAKIATSKDDELLKWLSSEEASDRERSRRELVRRGDRNRPALVKLLINDDAPLAARVTALGALEPMYDDSVEKAFLVALAEGDGELQRLAAEALGRHAKKGDRNVHDGLLKTLAIEDRAIRRTAAIAMGRLAGPGAANNLATALSFDDGKDPHMLDGLVRGLEMLGKPGMEALLALADSGVQKDLDRVVEAFRGLRARPGLDALLRLLRNPHLSSDQRAALVRSCTNYQLDPPVSLEPVVGWLVGETETPGVKKAMLEVLATPGVVTGPKAEAFVLDGLADDSEEVRQQAITASGQMKLARATVAIKAVLAGKDSSPIRREALRALVVLEPATALSRAKEFLTGKDATLQREAVRVLGANAAGAREVGRLFVAGKLPARLRPDVTEMLKKHAATDEEAAKLLREVKKDGE